MGLSSMVGRGLAAAVAALLTIGSAGAGNEIFRCVEAGRVTYADRECGGASTQIVASAAGYASTPSDLSTGVGPVELGMSPRMVHQAMGRPRETIATLEGRSLVEYWIWRHAGSTTRVAFREGRVTRVDVR